MHTLTFESPETPEFSIDKLCEVLITGNTSCLIYRSVAGSEFFPLTDEKGDEIDYPGDNPSGVVYNGTIQNYSRACKFKIALDPSQKHVKSEVQVIMSQGW